jgi:acetyl-CoA synthetase
MDDKKIHPITKEFSFIAHINEKKYQEMYEHSISDPENFWSEQAKKYISWSQPWTTVLTGDFKSLNVRWFTDGKLNACYNCVDRHLAERADQIAILWESDDGKHTQKITYATLHEKICKLSNVLKKLGIKKGDRVCIYLPMIPEAAIAMLACARIGAVHSVIFGGFSAESIKNRILDADCKLVITANEGIRGSKIIPLKKNVDAALHECPNVKNVLVYKHNDHPVHWEKDRDLWYQEEIQKVNADCPCEEMDANDPLFILYTSGSTGKPKGILHTTGGYLVYAAITHKLIFDYHDGDIYWCTADVGWVTGHTYLVYGPLCNGATTLMFEGVPNYPSPSRFWDIVDKYNVNIFYTAPTAIRALRQEGDEFVKKSSRKSLKLLGTVGEPINPDVWEWYYEIVGDKRCPIVDTWWQTETGGILISPFPGATPLKPGSATKPFFGIVPKIFDNHGKEVAANKMGHLVISQPWPGMMQTVYGDANRFQENYFKKFPGNYLTGDEARCDEEDYFWIAGREDDVLKISGHRIGTGEVENAFLEHQSVAEAAVVGQKHDVKGESIYAFVTLNGNISGSEELKKQLTQQVRNSIGAIATPEHIQWTKALPKTRSGKIMRRLLRKIANNDLKELGDVSTLADPGVVDEIIKNKLNNPPRSS